MTVGGVPRRGDRLTEGRRRTLMAEVHKIAGPMLAAAGLTRAACQNYERPGEIGVTWTIVVGECATKDVDRHDPYWAFTPRWRHWLSQLTVLMRNE